MRVRRHFGAATFFQGDAGLKVGKQIVGRERERAQLDLSVGEGGDGLRIVLLTGPSGLGKSTLLEDALVRARERGFATTVGYARSAALTTPLAPLLEALPALEHARRTAEGATPDIERLGAELVATLSAMTADTPLLIAFDDAQALDETSLALIPYIAGVSDRMDLTLLLVEQSDAVLAATYRATVDAMLARRVVQHIKLGPMSDGAIRELVAAVLGEDEPESVPSDVVVRAQGNPWFAQELAQAYARGDSELPTSIAASATSRLYKLSEPQQSLVLAIALCSDGADIAWLEAMAGQSPREFASTMEATILSGLIREDRSLYSIAHPLMQQALLAELSAPMRRALHLELVSAVEVSEGNEVSSARARGFHLSQAGRNSEAVECFLKAADANEINGQLHEAFADCVRALDAEPRLEQRATLLKRCAQSAMQVGSERAGEFWAELGRIAAATNDNETYAYALFQQYWTAYDGNAIDRLERAASLGSNDYGWSARAAACLRTLDSDYEGAIPHDLRALEIARAKNDPLLETLALEKLGLNYALVGRMDDSIESLQQAINTAIQRRFHGWALMAWTNLSDILIEKLEAHKAKAQCDSALKYVDDLGLERYRAMVQSFAAEACLHMGELEAAASQLATVPTHEQDDTDHFAAVIACIRARVANEVGDPGAAATAVEHAAVSTARHGWAGMKVEAEFEKARYLALCGRVDEAMAVADAMDPDESGLVARRALWLIRLSARLGRDELMQLALSDLPVDGETLTPLAALMLKELHATAALLANGKDDTLQSVVALWKECGRDLDANRALTTLALGHVRSGDTASAIARFTEARAAFSRLGALADADFVAGELRKLGTRSRARTRVTKVGNLTKRELQIARLVAKGLRNAEVAAQLFLAEKTIAAHLSNIYGKVGVNSRVQLAGWLKENDPEMAVA